MRLISKLRSTTLCFIFNVNKFLLDYRHFTLKFEYRLFFGYPSYLIIHLSKLVEVVISRLFEESICLLLSDDVQLLLSELVIANGFNVCNETFQSLIHLKHLVLSGDLLNFLIQS